MGGKRQRSMIGKLSELLVSGGRAGFLEATISPRSPLDLKIHSPRCIKNYDHGGGVGLGIVAALEKSGDGGDREILGKCCVRCPSKTPAIDPVLADKSCDGIKGSLEDLGMDDLEDYTYVICHGPNKSFTKVYYDGGHPSAVSVDGKVVHGVIATNPILTIGEEQNVSVFPTLEYLNSCHSCGKELHGEDIYMYREKAFCSMDCRAKQIANEERKEACRSEAAPRSSPNVSESAYADRKSIPAGILAV